MSPYDRAVNGMASTMSYRTVSPLLSVPPEIRNMIYVLIVKKNEGILVCSPRRKQPVKNRPVSENIIPLLLLNKQINNEASAVFYSSNTFIFGNGNWGLRSQTNLHAFKAFVSRVPAKSISRIRKVVIQIHFWHDFKTYVCPTVALESIIDEPTLYSLSHALVKRLTGLETLIYVAKKSDLSKIISRQIPYCNIFVPPDWIGLGVEDSVEIMTRHPTLKVIATQKDPDNHGLNRVIGRFMRKAQEGIEYPKFQVHGY
jgi:hypothetical protein